MIRFAIILTQGIHGNIPGWNLPEKKLPLCSIRPPFPLPRPSVPRSARPGSDSFLPICSPSTFITRTATKQMAYSRTLLGLYADYAPAPGLPDSPASSLLANAVFLIRSNFHHEYFHTEQLCQMLGVSRSTLYRAFQSELNISPGEFLSNFRIHQACRLLELGNSVKTAAVSCGFSDAFYFSRAFHRRMGVSPSDYRRQPQKQDAGSEYSRLVF